MGCKGALQRKALILAIPTALAVGTSGPALACVPEKSKITSYCQSQPVLSRLLSVVWPDSAPYQIAVIGGIARYPNLPKAQQLPPVDYDVDTLTTLLRTKLGFDEVIVLKEKDFSRENLKYLFSEYIPTQLQGRKNSQVLFAYSGHGADYRDTGYLFFSDTTTIDPKNYADLSQAMDMDDLKLLMKPTLLEATHVLALLNSCKGGYFVEGGSFTFGAGALGVRGAHGITAGGRENYVHANPNVGSGKGSVFFEMVFAALNGSGINLNGVNFSDPAEKDGILSTINLANFLNDTIQKIEDYRFGPQMGRLYPAKQGEGYFFFVTNQTKATQALRQNYPKSYAKAFGASVDETQPTPQLTPQSPKRDSIKPEARHPTPEWRLAQYAAPNSTIYAPGDSGTIKISAASRYVKAFATFPMLPREKSKIEASYSTSEGGLFIPFKLPANTPSGVYDVKVYIQEIRTKEEETHIIQFQVR
jgi:hypothetical protein